MFNEWILWVQVKCVCSSIRITIPSVVNWNGIVINGEIGIKLSVLGTIECLEWKIGYVYVKISKLIWIFYRSLTDLRSMWKLICREISYEKQG